MTDTITSAAFTAPLNKLRESAQNVRRTDADADIESLAADIWAKGLLQNLLVTPAADAEDTYEVVGGGRRFKALRLLEKQGKIAADHPVDVKLSQQAEAREVSLSENVQRRAMNPADEFEAFRDLIEIDGLTVTDVSRRFGVAERHILQRLKLGKVAPSLLDAYRAGDMTLDTLQAFTVSSDHGLQERVWEGAKSSPYINAFTIRQRLTEDKVRGNSALGRFVEEEYRAAGLPVTEDLFGDEAHFMAEDAHRIALEKLTAAANDLKARDGWAWVDPVIEYDYTMIASLQRLTKQPRELTKDQDMELDELRTLHNRLLSRYRPDVTVGAMGGPAYLPWEEEQAPEDEGVFCRYCGEQTEGRGEFCSTACEDTWEAVKALDPEALPEDLPDDVVETLKGYKERIAALKALAEPDYAPEDKAIGGGFVTIANDGTVEFRLGYVRPEDVPREGGDGGEGTGTGQDNSPTDGTAEKAPYSKALVSDLEAYRSQVFQAEIAMAPDHAKTLAILSMYRSVAAMSYARVECSSLSAQPTYLKDSIGTDMTATPAGRALDAALAEFTGRIGTKGDNVELFQRIHGLTDDEKDRLLAVLVALTCSVPLAAHGSRHADPLAEHIGREIGIDVASYWRPKAENFWGRVSKEITIGAVTVCTGTDAKAVLGKEKKAALASAVSEWVDHPQTPANDSIKAAVDQSPEAARRIARYLPEGMDFNHIKEAAE